MRKITIIILILISAKSFAEFTADVALPQVLKEINVYTVNDLGVGDSGFIQLWSGLCKFQNGRVGLYKYTELETERSEYVAYLKVTRIPNSQVTIAIPPQEQKSIGGIKLPAVTKVDALKRVAKSMGNLESCGNDIFQVASIEGTVSLTELLKLIKSTKTSLDESEKSLPKANSTKASSPVWTWLVIEDKSKIDDSTNVTMSLLANEEVYSTFGSTNRPTLVIRCKENTTEAYVITGTMLDSDDVLIRLDDEKAFPLKMSKSTSGKALFFPSVITNIKKFWNYHTMVFRFTPYQTGPSTVTFNISGLKNEISPLRRACHW